MYKFSVSSQAALEKAMSKAGIRVCASQKEKTNLGPVIRSWEKFSRWLRIFWEKTHLWYQALEETGESLILDHASNNPESTLWVLKVAVLNASLDNIKRCRYK
jgi:hypothetical protein